MLEKMLLSLEVAALRRRERTAMTALPSSGILPRCRQMGLVYSFYMEGMNGDLLL